MHSLNTIRTFKNQQTRHEEGCDKPLHLFGAVISLTCTLIPFQLHTCKSIFTTFLSSVFCVLLQGKVRIIVKSVSWNNLKCFLMTDVAELRTTGWFVFFFKIHELIKLLFQRIQHSKSTGIIVKKFGRFSCIGTATPPVSSWYGWQVNT